MSPVSLLLNILWILFGGLWMAAGWVIAGIIMAITIIGLPWARAAFNIAAYTLLPFGQKAGSRAYYLGRHDIGTGPLGFVGNVVWFVLRGWRPARRRLVAGARASGDDAPARRPHHRDPVRLGSPEARRTRALADRHGHRSGRGS